MEIDDLVYRTDENGEPLIKHKGKWYKSSDFKSFDLGEYIDKRIEKYLKDKEKIMRPLDDYIKEDKSKADEMFFNANFRKFYDKENAVCFNKGLLEIVFDKNFKSIEINNDSGEELWGNTIYNNVELTMYELQAIYEKCKELGWL